MATASVSYIRKILREARLNPHNTEMALAYQKACDKIDTLEKEVSELKTALQPIISAMKQPGT